MTRNLSFRRKQRAQKKKENTKLISPNGTNEEIANDHRDIKELY
jgi:hypothetical protein